MTPSEFVDLAKSLAPPHLGTMVAQHSVSVRNCDAVAHLRDDGRRATSRPNASLS